MTWSEAFARYLYDRGLTQQEAAYELRRRRIQATQSQVHYWCRGSIPRQKTRERIAKWSDGAVPAEVPGRAA